MQEWTALGHIESCIFLMYIIVKMSARFNVSMEERSNDEKKTIIASSDDKKLAIKIKKKGLRHKTNINSLFTFLPNLNLNWRHAALPK